ncbi:hypothetical protein DFJ63DRAFT_54120 [Scheffersomyces coipomensis]|uniref:uncharacterized protein n=1 Tax=Scheffersomyces coipomensis TaxID=1788519 RepID=UPI00315C7312
MTDRLNILDEIDEPINQITPKFKRKLPKVKTSTSQRAKFLIDDQDEDDELPKPVGGITTKSSSIKVRRPFKSFQSSSVRNKITSFDKIDDNDEQIDNMEVENFNLELDDDPENDPVIENMSELGDFKLRDNEEVKSPPPPVVAKKYVPIETNKFSIKISQKDLKDEYKDELSLDFNEEEDALKDDFEDSDVEMKQDHFIDDAPLKITKAAQVSENFQQISDKYDIEIGSGSESEAEDSNIDLNKKSTIIKVKDTLTLQEQVSSIKELIENLKLKKSDCEDRLSTINKELDDVNEDKIQLQAKLDSFEW